MNEPRSSLSFRTFIEKLKQKLRNPLFAKILNALSIVYPLVLMFLTRKEIFSIEWKTFIWVFLTSIMVYYFSLSAQNLVWSCIVDGNLTRFWINSQVYYQTILMKRLPGGVWHWLGRSNIYESTFPDEKRSVSKSNLIEWLSLLLTGFVGYIFTKSILLGFLGSTITIGIITWLLESKIKDIGKRIILSLCIFLLFMLCWLIGGLILFWLLSEANSAPVSFSSSFETWCLSNAISMLFFFIPSGSIIRDFSLGALLTNQLEPAKSLLVILQIRVIFLISDFLWSFLSLQIIKLFSKKPMAN